MAGLCYPAHMGIGTENLKDVRLEKHPRTVPLQPHLPASGLRGVGGISPAADVTAGETRQSGYYREQLWGEGERFLKAT